MLGSIFKKITQKSRLQYYREILSLARRNDYIITSLSDWYENDFYEGKKVLILRHDVDLLSWTAYRMFLVEKEFGVKSTFYFRWKSANPFVINAIKKSGFEVSLHYETLATFCKKKNIVKAEDLAEQDYSQCLEILKDEISLFEKRYGRIKTLCSHGDKRNRILGIPNHKIVENINRNELGIYFETYDKDIIHRFSSYISDSSIKDQHVWKYGLTPEQAISNGSVCICLLTHPHHWYYDISSNLARILLEFKDNFSMRH